jgi:peptidoglycan/LPS O-acetylase OafA/YrhL
VHYGELFVCCPAVVARIGLFPPLTDLPGPAYLRFTEFLASWHLRLSQFGVALFFLVSGFVIPCSLQRNSLGGFFLRRFFRLYPTLWVVQAVVLAVLLLQSRYHGLPFPFGRSAAASNAVLINSYLGHPFIETACWTLLVEELFYALCAVCAWRGVLHRPATVLLVALALAGLSLAFGWVRPGPGPRWQQVMFWLGANGSFVIFIFIGVVLHFLHQGAWRLRQGGPLVLALAGLYALCWSCGVVRHLGEQATWVVSALAALAVFVPLLLLNRWLPYSRWLDWLAEISYPLYLVHATLGYVVIRLVYLRTGSLYLGFAAAFAGAVALAALLHRFVERPGNNIGKRLAARLAPAAAAPVAGARRAA